MSGPISTVVVDDHDGYREALARVLVASGRFTVPLSCSRAPEALVWLAANEADLVVCDYHLEGMDGGSLCRELVRARSPVPVCLLSADSRRSTLVAALGSGAVGFVHKSVDSSELLSVLERVAGGRPAVDSQSALVLVTGARGPGQVGLERDQIAWLKGLADGVSELELAVVAGCEAGGLADLRGRKLTQLGVAHEAAAVGWALRNNVIE